jgi:hypothetical protein
VSSEIRYCITSYWGMETWQYLKNLRVHLKMFHNCMDWDKLSFFAVPAFIQILLQAIRWDFAIAQGCQYISDRHNDTCCVCFNTVENRSCVCLFMQSFNIFDIQGRVWRFFLFLTALPSCCNNDFVSWGL